ncbi:MAG: histidine kinase [Burkholderiaceae bacterium]
MRPYAEARKAPARLLLLEPQQLLRRTVTAVARELHAVQIDEATSTEGAQRLLDQVRFDAMVVSLDDEGAAVAMLERVRAGEFTTPRAVPVVVMTGACDERTVLQMRGLEVRRILLKPFKVKGVLETIAQLAVPLPTPLAANA